MTHIDLDPFYDLDPARLSPDQLDLVRYAFANAVTDFAARCRDHTRIRSTAFLSPDSVVSQVSFSSTVSSWQQYFGMPQRECLYL